MTDTTEVRTPANRRAGERTFAEHVAHLESARSWNVGDRVVVPGSGRTGRLVGELQRHNGFLVEWDEPVFGVEQGRVAVSLLERLDESEEKAGA